MTSLNHVYSYNDINSANKSFSMNPFLGYDWETEVQDALQKLRHLGINFVGNPVEYPVWKHEHWKHLDDITVFLPNIEIIPIDCKARYHKVCHKWFMEEFENNPNQIIVINDISKLRAEDLERTSKIILELDAFIEYIFDKIRSIPSVQIGNTIWRMSVGTTELMTNGWKTGYKQIHMYRNVQKLGFKVLRIEVSKLFNHIETRLPECHSYLYNLTILDRKLGFIYKLKRDKRG